MNKLLIHKPQNKKWYVKSDPYVYGLSLKNELGPKDISQYLGNQAAPAYFEAC